MRRWQMRTVLPRHRIHLYKRTCLYIRGDEKEKGFRAVACYHFILKKTSTTSGSKCMPERERMCSRTFSFVHASLYGRSERNASHTSTSANILAGSGISLALSPFGYP